MKVVNPLFRELDNQETAAHACNCVCNVASGNYNTGRLKGFWSIGTSCGCACASTSNENKSYNTELAVNN